MIKSLSCNHCGMSSFVPIAGQYGALSFLSWDMGFALRMDAFVVVEACERVASFTMVATLIVCDTNTELRCDLYAGVKAVPRCKRSFEIRG